MPPPRFTLYTFKTSHFGEKICWTLDELKLAYQEVVLTPVFHIPRALRMAGRGATTLPILAVSNADGGARPVECIQDSTHILNWLDERLGPFSIMPRDLAHREQVMAIEDRFDAIGQDVARYMFFMAFEHEDRVIARWTEHASRFEARLLRLAFPLLKRAFKRRLDITAEGAARSEQRIQQALAWLDGRLSDGRLYLVGDQFSVADITAASLLSPLACPDEHPIFGTDDFRQRMMPRHLALLAPRPSLNWVRRIYALHRRGATAVQAAAA